MDKKVTEWHIDLLKNKLIEKFGLEVVNFENILEQDTPDEVWIIQQVWDMLNEMFNTPEQPLPCNKETLKCLLRNEIKQARGHKGYLYAQVRATVNKLGFSNPSEEELDKLLLGLLSDPKFKIVSQS